jgi:hypothetical protein
LTARLAGNGINFVIVRPFVNESQTPCALKSSPDAAEATSWR